MDNLVLELLEKEKPVVIGHRGAAGLAVENTIVAIRKALELGVKIVEVDVRLTSDRKIVVFHDEDLKRLAGVDKKIRDLTLRDLREVRINNEGIPTLDEVLAEVSGKAGILIEIKEEGWEDLVVSSIKQNKAVDWSAVISFHEGAVQKVKLLYSRIPTGLIYAIPPGKVIDAKRLMASMVLPNYRILTNKHLEFAHKQGLKVVTWTVNEPSKALELALAGVDGITTDYPNLILEAISEARRKQS
jgi:glycerophosphoryl diester phosphodiesterase